MTEASYKLTVAQHDSLLYAIKRFVYERRLGSQVMSDQQFFAYAATLLDPTLTPNVVSAVGPGLDLTDGTLTLDAGVGTVPAPDYAATSNVTLTGSQVVDGGTPANGQLVLCTKQTNQVENGYHVVNTAGAWAPPAFYNTNAAVAALCGALSGAALNGAQNKGKIFYAVSGTTLAGAKVFAPVAPGVEINVSDAPWFWPGDGTNQETIKNQLQADMQALSTVFAGGVVRFGAGIFAFTSTFVLPARWSLIGCGALATELKILPIGQAPCDTVFLPGLLNVGGNSYSVMHDVRLTNPWGVGGISAWAPSSNAFSVGQYVCPQDPSNIILKLIAKTGPTGAVAPIGELTPINADMKMVGVSNVAAQVIVKPITGGYLGSFTFKMSANAGVTFGATQTTTLQDDQTFNVDACVGGSTYGATYGVKISNGSWPLVIRTVGGSGFVQPAVWNPNTPTALTVVLQVDTTAGLTLRQHVLGSTGGLWQVYNIDNDGVHMTLINIGANGAAAPGTTIPAGTTLQRVLVPCPRVEVLGTPAVANTIQDVLTYGGPLGSTSAKFQLGSGVNAEKWKFGLTVGGSANFATTGGSPFFDYTSPDPNLTIRFHTGLQTSSGTFQYMTPSMSWSMQIGTTVVDGGCTWQICACPAPLRSYTSGFTVRDVWLSGGAISFIGSQCEFFQFEGTNTYEGYYSVGAWFSNGDARFGEAGGFNNAIAMSGTNSFYSGFVSMVHDGGISFTTDGTMGFQGATRNCMFLSGLDGFNIGGVYLECNGALTRNSSFFGRQPPGTSVVDGEFGGGYWGSVNTAYTIDFYAGASIRCHGMRCGGSTAAFTGVSSCINFCVDACSHVHGLPMFDSWPISGSGFINDGGGTFYQIGNFIKSTVPYRTFAGTTDTTLATDSGGSVTSTGGSPAVVTVTTQAAGSNEAYEQGGAGTLTFVGSGVTIQTALASSGATTAQYQVRRLFWKDATHVLLS